MLADGPLAYYPLDEVTGTALDDLSQHQLVGSYGSAIALGAPGLVPSDRGGSAQFPGGAYSANDLAQVPPSPTLQPSAAFSIEFFFDSSAANASGGPIDLVAYGPQGHKSFAVQIAADNHVNVWIPGAAATTLFEGGSLLIAGRSYQLDLTDDGSTVALYLDGRLDGSGSASGPLVYAGLAGTGLTLGGAVNPARPTFGGRLAHVSYFGTALSAAQVAAHALAAAACASATSGSGGVGSATGSSAASASTSSSITSTSSGGAASSGTSGGGCPNPGSVLPGEACHSDCDCMDSGLCMAGSCFPQFANSVFRAPLPQNPKTAPNSAAIFKYYIDNWALNTPQNGSYNTGFHPKLDTDGDVAAIFFAKATDPVYTLHCTTSWGCGALEGIQLHIPSNAKWEGWPATGNDTHMQLVTPDGKTMYSFWQAWNCLTAGGGKCVVAAATRSDFATGNGFSDLSSNQNGSIAEASGWMSTEGLILPSELAAGVIPHALSICFSCHDGKFVAPAVHSDGPGVACSAYGGSDANVLTVGQRVFFNATDAQIAAWNVPPYTKTLATALAHYGAYFTTTEGYGGSMGFGINHTSYVPGGLQDAWPATSAMFGGIPQTDVNGGYDMGMDQIPGGWASWLSACDRNGC